MGGLKTWDYIAAPGALVLVYVGHKHSGAYKWITWGVAAWLLYGVYQDYTAGTSASS